MTALLCVIFFLSGASALLFESLWFHLSALVFGNSVWASSIVLAGFMGGLGIGNGLAAVFGRKVRSPILVYAGVELVIAVTGIGLVFLLPALTGLMAPLFRSLSDNTLMLNGARLAGAFVLMLIPTTAMGVTLPLLVKTLYAQKQDYALVLGMLYGWNTLGAVVGVMANEMVLLEWLGVRGTGLFAGGLNTLAALLAIRLAAGMGKENGATAPAIPAVRPLTSGAFRLLLAGSITGAIILGLEVVWFRFMVLFFSADDTNFAVMLAVVLAGISAGGLLGSRVPDSWSRGRSLLISALLFNGLAVALLYRFFGGVLAGAETMSLHSGLFMTGAFLMFPVACVSGVLFTMLGKALHDEIGDETRATGFLTLFNTAGGVLGALVAGLVLIPAAGVERSFFLAAWAYGLAAIMLIDRGLITRPGARWMAGMAAAFIVALCWFLAGPMEKYLSVPLRPFVAWGERRVALREGITETIQYLRREFRGKPLYYRLVTNGHSMSVTNMRGRRYMKLYVYWPVAVRPSPRKALLICYGCGCTAKAITDTTSLQEITVVDLSRDVVGLSNVVYPEPESNPVNDPRVKIRIEDGRFFLQTAASQFDLITAEPPPPTYSGIVNLYTREYFQLIKDRLADGGAATYWLPVYQLSPAETKAILRAFSEVFPDCTLWTGAERDWMMVGMKNPGSAVSEERFGAQWKDPIVAREMQALGFQGPEQLGALFIADGARLAKWIGDTPPLVDNYPRRLRPGSRISQAAEYLEFMDPDAACSNFVSSAVINRIWPESMKAAAVRHFKVRPIIDRLLGPSLTYNLPSGDVYRCLTDPALDGCVVWALRSDNDSIRILDETMPEDVKNGSRLWESNDSEEYLHLAASFALRGQRAGLASEKKRCFVCAEEYLARMTPLLSPPTVVTDRFHMYRISLLFLAGETAKAERLRDEYAALVPADRKSRQDDITRYWNWMAGR